MDSPDISTAAPADAETRLGRRLLGAGLIGVAGSLLTSIAASAAATTTTAAATTTTTTAPPLRPTAADETLLNFAQTVEFAAVSLYTTALSGTALDDTGKAVFATLRDAHRAYANSLGAFIGKTAPDTPDADVVSSNEAAFKATTQADLAKAALALENTAVATHTDIVGELQGTNGAKLIASILITEARHAIVLSDLAGVADLDAKLTNDATALKPKKG